jgi:hypothetical protein
MYSLSASQQRALIESNATDLQIAQAIAHQSKPKTQTSTLVWGSLLALASHAVVPGLGPIVVVALTIEHFIEQGKKASKMTRDINAGRVWDYLPEDAREDFKALDPQTIDVVANLPIDDSPIQFTQQPGMSTPRQHQSSLERTLEAVAPVGLPQSLIASAIDRPYSTFIFGQSAAGKDITLFNIMEGLKVKFPTAYFLGIDGKNHTTESAMWEMYDESIRISMLDDPRDYHDRLLQVLNKAVRWPGRAFVSFSEVNGISGVYAVAGMAQEWKQIAHLISFLAVQGNADGKFIYATAQALNLDALGLRKDSRANCAFMAVANSTQFSFLSQIAGDTKVFQNKLMLDQQVFQSACSRSTATQHLQTHNVVKGIAWFHTDLNRWEPMPRLVNPGPDRGESEDVNVPEVVDVSTTSPPSKSAAGDRPYLLQLIKDLKTSNLTAPQKAALLEQGKQIEAHKGEGAAIAFLEQSLGI